QLPEGPRDVEERCRPGGVVIRGLLGVVEVCAENDLFACSAPATHVRDHDIHVERLEARPLYARVQHYTLAGLEKLPQLCALTVRKIEAERDALELVRLRPHPGVCQHVGEVLRAIVIQVTDNGAGTVLQHGQPMDLPAIARAEYDLAADVTPLVIRIPRPCADPHEFGPGLPRIRVRDDTHSDLRIADDPLIVRLDHAQFCRFDVPAGWRLPPLIVDPAVGREGFDVCVRVRETRAPQLGQYVLCGIAVATRPLDP